MVAGRRARKKAANRAALAAAARGLFARKGLYSTTIEDVTEAADLAKGTFYTYFASRDDLIAELVRETLCDLVDRSGAACAGADTCARRAEAIIGAHAQLFSAQPDTVLLLHQARGWAKLPSGKDSAVRKEFKAYVESLAELFQKSKPKGSCSSKRQSLATARALAGCIAGLQSFKMIAAEPEGRAEGLTDAVHLLIGLFTK